MMHSHGRYDICKLKHTHTPPSPVCCLSIPVYVVTVEKLGLKDPYTQFLTAAAPGKGERGWEREPGRFQFICKILLPLQKISQYINICALWVVNE